MTEVEEFRAYLSSRPSGPVPVADLDAVASALWPVWNELADPDELRRTAMWDRKLWRIERATWEPPVLSFDVERHGGLMAGGTRAEVQTWEVDVARGRAWLATERSRQIRPMAARVKVGPLVDEVVALVSSSADDERLAWSADRLKVRVNLRAIAPLVVGYASTTAGRQERFSALLQERMAEISWERDRGFTYRRRPQAPAGQ